MHSDLKTLIELQQLDLKIAEVSAQIEKLPGQIQSLENKLSEFIHAHEDRQRRLAANQKERREMDGEIQLIRQKISKHRDQLYEVKTNEQYRAMLREIEGEETKIRSIEDQILEKMIEAEDLQKRVTEAAAHLEGEKSRVGAEKSRLEELRKADVAERDGLLARRGEIAGALSEEVRVLYERVRKGRGGVAMAEVRDGLCTACSVLLRPQLYNEVRSNEGLHECENCARILYYCPEAFPAGSESSGEQAAAQN